MEMLHRCFGSLLPLLFASLVFLVLMIKQLKKLRRSLPKPKLPPGPKKLPLIGNLHQLSRLPHRSLWDLAKKHGPIMYLQLGQVPAIVISSPTAAEEVLKKHELTFSQRPIPIIANAISYGDSGIFLAPYGSHWREVRKICVLELLSSSRVQSFKSMRENEVWNLIESIRHDVIASSSSIPINFSQETLQLSTRITCMAALGYDCKETDAVISLIKDTMENVFQIADSFPSLKRPLELFTGMKSKLNKLHLRLDNVLNNIINDHIATRAEGGGGANDQKDLLDVLLRLNDNESNEHPILMTSIKAIIWEIIGAGIDTSSTAMEWAMSELMRNPRVMKKAQEEARRVLLPAGKERTKLDDDIFQDLIYLKLVIKETLRLHPSVPLSLRESSEKCEISGYEIPANVTVCVNVSALGSNPEWWGDDADCFKPERFDGSQINYQGNYFQYLPFGSGRRICPGMTFSNAVMELVLGLLLCHFDWKLPDGIKPEELDMTEVFGVTVTRKHPLCLIATPLL